MKEPFGHRFRETYRPSRMHPPTGMNNFVSLVVNYIGFHFPSMYDLFHVQIISLRWRIL
jgi:hypothetical protein